MIFSKILNNDVYEARNKIKLLFIIICVKIMKKECRLKVTKERLYILASFISNLSRLKRKKLCRLLYIVIKKKLFSYVFDYVAIIIIYKQKI